MQGNTIRLGAGMSVHSSGTVEGNVNRFRVTAGIMSACRSGRETRIRLGLPMMAPVRILREVGTEPAALTAGLTVGAHSRIDLYPHSLRNNNLDRFDLTKKAILQIYDAMTDAIRTGEPYRTVLNPPPGHGPATQFAKGPILPSVRSGDGTTTPPGRITVL
jgi:hypothetical protein